MNLRLFVKRALTTTIMQTVMIVPFGFYRKKAAEMNGFTVCPEILKEGEELYKKYNSSVMPDQYFDSLADAVLKNSQN